MNLIDTIRIAWGFTGLSPQSILDMNAFGNLLIEDINGGVWRNIPEELSCSRIASSIQELEVIRTSQEFQQDWRMEQLAELATSALGKPADGSCYSLKVPVALGGTYERGNLAIIPIPELISAAGNIAGQIKDLPDGSKISFKISD